MAATAIEWHSEPGYVLLSACYVDKKGGKHYDSHQYEIVFATPEPEMINLPFIPPSNACPHCEALVIIEKLENPRPDALVKKSLAEGKELLHQSYYCEKCNRGVCTYCESHPHPVGPPEMRDEWARERKRLGFKE